MLIKGIQLISLAIAITATARTHGFAQGSTAPLFLFISGGGSVSPLTNSEMLVVDETYNMIATPGAGFTFNGWQPVNVFTFTSYTIDASGNTNAVVSIVRSPGPTYTNQPSLNFVMQPEVVLQDNPGVSTITKSSGWQANFDPIVLSIQSSGPSVILSWTNSFKLQAAPASRRCLHEYHRGR